MPQNSGIGKRKLYAQTQINIHASPMESPFKVSMPQQN